MGRASTTLRLKCYYLVTEENVENTYMSPLIVNRSNVHLVWPNKRDIQILNGNSILVFYGYFWNTPKDHKHKKRVSMRAL